MRKLLVLILASANLPQTVFACSCTQTKEADDFKNADAVFDGTVIKVDAMPPLEAEPTLDRKVVTFYVTNYKKAGNPSLVIRFFSSTDSLSPCGKIQDFKQGAKFTIYAKQAWAYELVKSEEAENKALVNQMFGVLGASARIFHLSVCDRITRMPDEKPRPFLKRLL